MKFLLDQDVPYDLIYLLTALGHDVLRVREALLPEAADSQVLHYAHEHGCVLVTCNRNDFLALAEQQPHQGIIVLIRRRTRAAERASLLRLLERAGDMGLAGNINFA